MVSIQSPYIFASKYRCFSPSRNLVSCSHLSSWLYFFSCLSYGDVIYGTSYLCYLGYLSYGNFICGTFGICLAAYTTTCITRTIVGTARTIVGTACNIIGIAHTIVGTANGFILPFIIFYALTSMLFCSFFTLEPQASPSSTLFFLLRALFGEFTTTFFQFSNDVCISSLVLLTLANGYYGFSF